MEYTTKTGKNAQMIPAQFNNGWLDGSKPHERPGDYP